MALESGTQLGHYEITDQIGQGGMGEVYRARDTKLRREVAIKVLPAEFSQDEERLARLEREARMLASLNHPNIAAIHGLEDQEGTRFLVLELVGGETLAERLRRGPIPVEESLGLALQISRALEAAHERGVIHRDLKPANIKITPEGSIKILDFGLAKAFVANESDASLTSSPTLSMEATRQGVILGTAAYMSPEQARGQETDRRTDIWSFGCVLFEMLGGRPVFGGDTVSDVLASVLKSIPDWKSLPEAMHPRIGFLLERCLDRDIRDRYQGIGDARVEIQKVLADPAGVYREPAETSTAGLSRRQLLGWTAGSAAAAGLTGLGAWHLKPSSPGTEGETDETVTWSWLDLAVDGLAEAGLYPAFSPDGNRLAFVGRDPDGVDRLYVHHLDEGTTRVLPDTEGAELPFFSPDGEWVAFSLPPTIWKSRADGTGNRVQLAGGQTLGDLIGAWVEGEIIVGQRLGPLRVISDTGGDRPGERFTREEDEAAHRFPQVLPGGDAVLFGSWRPSSGAPSLDVVSRTGENRKRVVDGAGFGRYLSSGHLVYTRGGTLYARTFDLDTLEAGENEFPVLEGIQVEDTGVAHIAFAPNGRVAHRRNEAPPGLATLELVENGVRTGPLPGTGAAVYETPRFSPDGERLAVVRRNAAGNGAIEIHGLERTGRNPLTVAGGINRAAFVWSHDGRFIFYASGDGISCVPTDRVAPPQLLVDGERFTAPPAPISLTRDGTELAGTVFDPTANGVDIWIVRMDSSGSEPRAEEDVEWFAEDPGDQVDPAVSPDGRWVAYSFFSQAVSVRPRNGEGAWPVGPGARPIWSKTEDRLYVLDYNDGLRIVSYDYSVVGDEFILGGRVPRSEPVDLPGGIFGVFDVDPTNDRLVVLIRPPQEPNTRLRFLTNFSDWVRRRTGAADG